MSQVLFEEVGARFPDNKYSSVGGFLFLRFFCPAIVSPERNNLTSRKKHLIAVRETSYLLFAVPVSRDARRFLVLISKLLQNISNGTIGTSKEKYMTMLQDFMEQRLRKLESWFEELVVRLVYILWQKFLFGLTLSFKKTIPATLPFSETKSLKDGALFFIANQLKEHIHKIGRALAADPTKLKVVWNSQLPLCNSYSIPTYSVFHRVSLIQKKPGSLRKEERAVTTLSGTSDGLFWRNNRYIISRHRRYFSLTTRWGKSVEALMILLIIGLGSSWDHPFRKLFK